MDELKNIENKLDNLVKVFDTMGKDETKTAAFNQIMELPEDQFAVASEELLRQFEKEMNDPAQSVTLVAALNSSGITFEELEQDLPNVFVNLDAALSSTYSQTKIDFLKRLLGTMFKALSEAKGIAKKVIPIPIELCHHDARIPVYARLGDAGMDIYAVEDITIKPGETKLIPTGIKCAIPLGYELQVRPRSGLSLKSPLRVANAPGTIDSGYRDEIGVIITNIESPIKNIEQEPVWDAAHKRIEYFQVSAIEYGQSYTITKGMKFAQLVLNEVPTCSFFEVEDVGKIEGNRGGGFGHSGV